MTKLCAGVGGTNHYRHRMLCPLAPTKAPYYLVCQTPTPMILFGWNNYLLKSVSLDQLGSTAAQSSDLRFEYRQKYFHLFFIPCFPLGRFWAVRQGGKLYQPTPEAEQALRSLNIGGKQGLWAWTGPLLGIACWIIFGISSGIEDAARQRRNEEHSAMLTAFFGKHENTAPLAGKLETVNELLDSALQEEAYREKIDTTEEALMALYLTTRLTTADTLNGYNPSNTLVVSQLYGSSSERDVVSGNLQEALQSGAWKKGYYGDTSSVFADIRKLEAYKYLLVLKENNRVQPTVMTDGYASGYALVKGAIINIETGAVEKEFKLLAGNSEKVDHYQFGSRNESSVSSSQWQRTLDADLSKNIRQQANKYVFGEERMY